MQVVDWITIVNSIAIAAIAILIVVVGTYCAFDLLKRLIRKLTSATDGSSVRERKYSPHFMSGERHPFRRSGYRKAAGAFLRSRVK